MATPTDSRHESPVRERALERPPRGRTTTQPYRDAPVDVRIVLAALWTAMLFVYAYVDIFAFFREDVLRSALDGKVASLDLSVNQAFLTATLIYVLVPALMVVLSLLLVPRVARMSNIVISAVYLVTVVVSCIGETWAYYLIGSAVEVVLLAVIARTAWRWPRQSAG